MSRIIVEIVVGLVSLLSGILAGLAAARRHDRQLRALADISAGTRIPTSMGTRPITVGLVTGILLSCALMGIIAADDRFYSPGAATRVLLATLAGYLMIVFSDHLLVLGTLLRHGDKATSLPKDKLAASLEKAMRGRWAASLIMELLASVLVVLCGVKFKVLGLRPEHAWNLGIWSTPLTVVWILAATNVGKLLSGIDGAINILLLAAGGMVFYATMGVNEHFLNTFTVIIVAAAVASLRYNFFPARLPLTSAGTTAVGFLFAVLTVLARQKTAVMFLLIVPLVVVVLLIGGAMMNFVERSVSTDDRRRK